MNLNLKQILAIIAAALGVLTMGTAQLTDLFGSGMAKAIGSAAGLLSTMINSVLAVITGQAAIIKEISNTEGVEPIKINKDANPTLARIALDPAMTNIDVVEGDRAKITATSKE